MKTLVSLINNLIRKIFMIVTKDTSVDFPFFIIKDFLPNPEVYRKMVLEAEYDQSSGYWVGDNIISHPFYANKTLEYIASTASGILQDYIWYIDSSFINFRRLTQPKHSELHAHIDRFSRYDFDEHGRPIYVNHPMWSFIFDFTPQEQSARLCFCEDLNGQRFATFKTPVDIPKQQDSSQWKIYKDFYYSYNTAVMFPSNYWHTAIDFACSKEMPRTMGVAWIYSGFNAKYNKCGIPLVDK